MNGSVDLRQLAIDRSDDSRPARRAPRRHILTRYVMPGAIAAGFVALIAWSLHDVAFPPTPVTVSSVISVRAEHQRGGAPLFQAAGWIEPRPTPIRVAALAPGIVAELLVVDDQPVSAGEPIARLVKEDAQLALERSQADVKLREAEVDEAESNLAAATTRLEEPVHLEALLGESEALLAEVETLLKNLPYETQRAIARREYAELDYVGKKSIRTSIAARSVDAAKAEFDSAEAMVRELQDRQSALEKQQTALQQKRDAQQRQLELLTEEKKALGESTARLKAAQARLAQAKVQMAEAQLRLDRMTITAPVDGRIYQLIGHPGAKVGGDLTRAAAYDGSTIVTMYQPDKLQVRVDVRFEDVPHVSLGQPVEINNPALSQPLTGNVLYVSSEADIQKNTLQVKVAIDDPPPVFKPEMLVDVTFLEPEHAASPGESIDQRQLLVPAVAIHSSNQGDFVWIADHSERRARRQLVQTGASQGALIAIRTGLNLTSRVIVSSASPLQEGQRIAIGQDESRPTYAASAAAKRPQLSRLPVEGTP
ncbi:efflux RND transporter periplasmic adaptor subunit [Blastopirellula marina]|uniref:Hemolysin D n=1 Tax=Blastopirellula marina TaxID=124 RepID=A0A2S8GNR1_9BACT|nr:efflux RND transporter periplasmic adaptor subunit [Blastopirellula marina]PQO45991.1 hemolysin D [Blastopirellula marina]